MSVYLKAAKKLDEGIYHYMCNAIWEGCISSNRDLTQIKYKRSIMLLTQLFVQDVAEFNSGCQYDELNQQGYYSQEIRLLTLLFLHEITKGC